MFERFTDQARRAVVMAQKEAKWRNDSYVNTEHILLGVLQVYQGMAAQALESAGVDVNAVIQETEEIGGRNQRAPSAHIPFTLAARKVLELASREAENLGQNFVGTEHILLSLLHEGESAAAQILVRNGADLDRIRREITTLT